ncbi:alpha- and gamma-adaptin-binding protein p34 [Strongylocentrotus purpuratus]|uniref:Alpha-and gamma-adaptin-binding protein p34 n=1 Tax=Strongylocentrotus purpuratus TaxID=7668 RepID=A0A7M7NBZ7_STRPU|nr:alpha- and gamma-adaptin-binding protein p34 [Strongylocentrotus purpuratus]
MATPTALLVSCSPSIDAHSIMKKITENDAGTPFTPIAEEVEGYPWQLSNKYYTADILICIAEPCIMGSLSLGESMEGIVIAMDDKVESFKTAKSQWAIVKEINPEVRILACKQFTKTPGVSKQVILEWCLENSFELVELERPENEDDEEEDGFGVEPYGVERIVSALHAHTWSNLEMKDDNGSNLLRLQERFGENDNRTESENHTSSNDASMQGYIPLCGMDELSSQESQNSQTEQDNSQTEQDNSQTEQDNTQTTTENAESASADNDNVRTTTSTSVEGRRKNDGGVRDAGSHGKSNDPQASSGATSALPEGADASASDAKPEKAKKEATAGPDKIDAMLNEDKKIFEALGNEDPGMESFEQLFSRMTYMKDKAETLEGEERRQYAEKVAVAFWKAIGGDEGEIDGLGDDSD